MRELILTGETFDGNTPIEQATNVLLEAVRRDYGGLIEKDQVGKD